MLSPPPRHVLRAVGERHRADVDVILEYLTTVRDEQCRAFRVRHLFHGGEANPLRYLFSFVI